MCSLNWLYLLLAIIGSLIVEAFEYFCPSINQGFYCQDPSISHKWRPESFPTFLIVVYSISTFALFLITESLLLLNCDNDEGECNNIGSKLKRIWWNVKPHFINYYYGFMLCFAITSIIKVFAGEPRPIFMEFCMPNRAVNCTKGEFVDNYVCTNSNRRNRIQSTKSFPSGHASLLIFSAVFAVYYLQKRVRKLHMRYVTPFVQTAFALVACYGAISRVTDRMHFFWDVMAGAMLGTLIAICTVKTVCNNFTQDEGDDVTIKSYGTKGNLSTVTITSETIEHPV